MSTGNMEELLTAIGTFWDSSSCATLRGLVAGGLHVGQAPDGTRDGTELYCVETLDGGSFEETFTSNIERPVVNFAVYAPDLNSYVALVQARDALCAAFDDKLFTLSNDAGGNARNMIETTRTTCSAPIPDPDMGWFVVVSYEMQFGTVANTNR
jgi:hypothetical protein